MITIYIGKSGAGKDTFCKKRVRTGSKPIISYTTRPIRTGEINGVDYNYVTDEEFFNLINNDSLMEFRHYNTLFDGKPAVWYYGSPKVDTAYEYSCVVDINGAISYIKTYGPENINIVYVAVDDDIRVERAKTRGTFSEEEWNRRLIDDNEKFSIERLEYLARMLDKPITIINNNGDKPLFSKLECHD